MKKRGHFGWFQPTAGSQGFLGVGISDDRHAVNELHHLVEINIFLITNPSASRQIQGQSMFAVDPFFISLDQFELVLVFMDSGHADNELIAAVLLPEKHTRVVEAAGNKNVLIRGAGKLSNGPAKMMVIHTCDRMGLQEFKAGEAPEKWPDEGVLLEVAVIVEQKNKGKLFGQQEIEAGLSRQRLPMMKHAHRMAFPVVEKINVKIRKNLPFIPHHQPLNPVIDAGIRILPANEQSLLFHDNWFLNFGNFGNYGNFGNPRRVTACSIRANRRRGFALLSAYLHDLRLTLALRAPRSCTVSLERRLSDTKQSLMIILSASCKVMP